MRRVERMQMGRRREIAEALFPGYLFIHLDKINDNWLPIRSTLGVHRIVRFGEYPTPVADVLIDRIRQRMQRGPAKVPYLKPGEPVKIVEGSFAQVEAIFVADDGEERVMLLMNILGSEHRLSFPVASVRKI